MREFRLVWMVASVAAAAVAAAFVVVLFQIRSHKPSSSALRKIVAEDKKPTLPKTSTRLLAPTTLNYYRVKVALDGTLKTDKHTLRLYAADVPGREYTCAYRNGQRWACGLRAYVALLNAVGSTPIECHPHDALKPDIVVCHQGHVDLSQWMLKEGWARLHQGVTDPRYIEAAKAAEAAKVGMWLEAPQVQQNATAQ